MARSNQDGKSVGKGLRGSSERHPPPGKSKEERGGARDRDWQGSGYSPDHQKGVKHTGSKGRVGTVEEEESSGRRWNVALDDEEDE